MDIRINLLNVHQDRSREAEINKVNNGINIKKTAQNMENSQLA